MPIQSITQRQRNTPILGTIRLGERKESKSGAMYPTTVDHFVLTDAPEVAKIYGEDPTQLDIIFPTDDVDIVLPTWLKLWGANSRDAKGAIKSGDLKCVGNGPDAEGKPGTADWFARRDPNTRVVPTRPCLGEACPDWNDSQGRRACKQTMQVLAILPRVSWFGVYIISTTSWRSIHNFHTQVEWVRSLNNNRFSMMPFKIVREEETTSFMEKGQKKSGTQFIMKLKPNENFFNEHGGEVQKKMAASFQQAKVLLPTGDELLHEPMPDLYPTLEAGAPAPIGAPAVATDRMADVASVVADLEVIAAFDQYEQAIGRQFPQKSREIAVKKKINEPSIKAAVLATLAQLTAEAPKPKKPAAQEQPPTIDMEPAPPLAAAANSDGIL
jgi:hypothetical protein